MAGNSSNTDVKVVFDIFGKRMINVFDQNITCVQAILNREVSSKTSTALKYLEDIIPIWESPLATSRDLIKRGIAHRKDARTRMEANKLAHLAYKWSKEGVQMKETLCQAACELCVSFYSNITRVTTKHGLDETAIKTLAKVAVSNFMIWYFNQPEEKPFSVEIITEGVTANMEASSLFQHNQAKVYDKVTKTEYNPIKLFTKTGLAVDDGNNARTYYVKRSKQPSKYGYRFLFQHEMKNKSDVLNGYVQIPNANVNMVKPKVDKGIWCELLNAIGIEDPKHVDLRSNEHMEQAIQRIVQMLLADFLVQIQNKFNDAITGNAGTNSDASVAPGSDTFNIQGDKNNTITRSNLGTLTLNIN